MFLIFSYLNLLFQPTETRIMKRLFQYLFLFFLISLLVSCSKDELEQEDEMNLSVDGSAFKMLSSNTQFEASKMISNEGILSLYISAVSKDKRSVILKLPVYTGAQKYLMGSNDYMGSSGTYSEGTTFSWLCRQKLSNLEENMIEITYDDGRRVEDNFNFSGVNESDLSIRKIQEGKFRIRLK